VDRDVPMTAKMKSGHLNTIDKQLLLSDTVAAAIAYAWDVTPFTVRRIQNQSLEVDGLAVTRKVRFDRDDTLFTSDARCKQVYTPLYAFKKTLRMANRGEELTINELNDRWAMASPATKEAAEFKARHLRQRGPHLSRRSCKSRVLRIAASLSTMKSSGLTSRRCLTSSSYRMLPPPNP
jgi:hypothetical protein